MKAAVITFPGSNRDGDVAKALKQAGADVVHVWHADTALPQGVDLVVLPGGFSYGDYLRTGAIAGRAHIMDATRAHAARGGYVLGICNGFQIACEAGLLPGILVRNAHLKFVCKRQHLKVERNDTAFTRAYAKDQAIDVCIAHGEGNYTADEDTINELETAFSLTLNHLARNEPLFGNKGAPPAPNRARMTRKLPNPQARGVKIVNTDHHSMAPVPVMRRPNRSDIIPPGICRSM